MRHTEKRLSYGRSYLVYYLWFSHRGNLLATEGWSSHRRLRADPRGSLFLFVYFRTRVKIILGSCEEEQGEELLIKHRRERSGRLRARISISLVCTSSRGTPDLPGLAGPRSGPHGRPRPRPHARDGAPIVATPRRTPTTTAATIEDAAVKTNSGQSPAAWDLPIKTATDEEHEPRRRRLRAGFACRRPPATARGRRGWLSYG